MTRIDLNDDLEDQRFVDFSDREYSSVIHNFEDDLMPEYLGRIKHAKWNEVFWKGRTLMKDPMSLSMYQQLLQELEPRTILEFGTYDGGSALWMRDVLESIGADCQIHTFDIKEDRVELPRDSGIHFHRLDNHEIRSFVDENRDLFEEMEHPVLVIEDSHENAEELLLVVDQFLESGDYLVVEDTLAEWKHEVLCDVMEQTDYSVDTRLCDLWGHNNSWNFNGVLRKN